MKWSVKWEDYFRNYCVFFSSIVNRTRSPASIYLHARSPITFDCLFSLHFPLSVHLCFRKLRWWCVVDGATASDGWTSWHFTLLLLLPLCHVLKSSCSSTRIDSFTHLLFTTLAPLIPYEYLHHTNHRHVTYMYASLSLVSVRVRAVNVCNVCVSLTLLTILTAILWRCRESRWNGKSKTRKKKNKQKEKERDNDVKNCHYNCQRFKFYKVQESKSLNPGWKSIKSRVVLFKNRSCVVRS